MVMHVWPNKTKTNMYAHPWLTEQPEEGPIHGLLIFSVRFELLSDGRREHFTAAPKRVDQDDGATEKESSGVAVGWPAFTLTWVLLKTAGGNWTSWRTTWSVVRQATSPMTGWRDSSCSAAEMDLHTSKDTLTVLHSPFNRHGTYKPHVWRLFSCYRLWRTILT